MFSTANPKLWPALLAMLTLPASGVLVADEPGPPPVPGVTINVTGFTDAASADAANCTGTDPVECPTLRDALVFANQNGTAEGSQTEDTINLPAGTYVLDQTGLDETFEPAVGEQPPVLTNQPDATIGDLDITQSLVIQGAGSAATVVEWSDAAGNRDRVFHVYHPTEDVNATLIGLTARNGNLLLTPDLGPGPPSEFGPLPTTYEGLRHGGGIALGAAAVVSVNDPNKEGDVAAGTGGSQRPTDPGGDTGGSYTLNLQDVRIADSYSDGDGGGLFNAGDLTATGMVIADNLSAKNGGGQYNEGNTLVDQSSYLDNDAEGGGAIFATGNPATKMTITNSTVAGNTAIGGAGISGRVVTLEIANSTISGNVAKDVGGGIHSNGVVLIDSCTIVGNRATGAEQFGGAGVNVFPAGSVSFTLVNTVLSANTAGSDAENPARIANCGCTGSQTNCVTGNRAILTAGYNLSDDDTCNLDQTSDQEVTDVFLGPLADNGGLTLTHALLSQANGDAETSPAIDTGPRGADASLCRNNDQRGQIRPADGDHQLTDVGGQLVAAICDKGAFELFIPLADLHINGLDLPQTQVVGDDFQVVVSVHNGNEETNEIAEGVVLTALLPPELAFVSGSYAVDGGASGACTADAGTVTCAMGDIGIDAEAAATLLLNAASVGTGQLEVQITASAPADPNEANNETAANIRILGISDLAVAGNPGSDPVNRGESYSASFTVTNNGPDDATEVILGLELADGTTFVSATPDNGSSCVAGNDSIRCELGAMSMASPVVNVAVVVTADSDAGLAMTAQVTAEQDDRDASNDSASLSAAVNPVSDIALAMQANRQNFQGNFTAVVTLTVSNAGPSPATGVVLSGTMPADVSITSIVPTQGNCQQTGLQVNCQLGDLAVNEDASVVITAPILSVGEYEFSAQAEADPLDPDPDNNGGIYLLTRDSKGGSCAYDGSGRFDPTLPGAVVLCLTMLLWRKRSRPELR